MQDAVNAHTCVAVGPGTFDGKIKLPPGHTLRGAGIDQTILQADLPNEVGGQGAAVLAAGDCCGTVEPTRIIEDMTLRALGATGNPIGWSNFSARRVRLENGLCHGAFVAGPNVEILDSVIEGNAWPRWNDTLGRMIDCRDNGGQIQGAGIYIPLWATTGPKVEDTYFSNNNGSDIDCYGSPRGIFRGNTTRNTAAITGLQFYNCPDWTVEQNDIETLRPNGGWGGWWCYPSNPGANRPAAVFACLSSGLLLRDNILSAATYGLVAWNSPYLRSSGNTYHGLKSRGSYTGIRSARFLSASVPSTVQRDATFNVTVKLQNSGLGVWLPGYTHLGDPADSNTVWGVYRHPISHPLDPASWGGRTTTTITATLHAPSTRGYHRLQLRMVEERVEWFGSTLTRYVFVR